MLPALVKFGRWRGRLTFVSDDGPVPVSAVIVAHRDRHGEIATVSLVARDLTELRVGPGARRPRPRRRFAALVENVADLIAVVDPDGTIAVPQPGRHPHPRPRRGRARRRAACSSWCTPTTRPPTCSSLAQPDEQGIGSPVELRLRASRRLVAPPRGHRHRPERQPGHRRLVLNARDVTERVEAARALANRAFTDPLTGLPNRVRLLDRLASGPGRSATLGTGRPRMVCDIDQFKPLNTVVGREARRRAAAHRGRPAAATTLGDRHPWPGSAATPSP